MTDHADTIRVDRAWLDALLAERQQAQRIIDGLQVDLAAEKHAHTSDNEYLIEQRQQAIDALREIARDDYRVGTFERRGEIARAALVKLGEKP